MCAFDGLSFGKKFMQFGPVVSELFNFMCKFFEKKENVARYMLTHKQTILLTADSDLPYDAQCFYEHFKTNLSKIGSFYVFYEF